MFFPEAARLLSAPIRRPDPSSKMTGASIDTRTLRPGNLFVALPGTKTDGHQFLKTAFEKGAAGALIQENYWKARGSEFPAPGKNIIPVPDPAVAFLVLAEHYRQSFSLAAAVGVVGSVGKTSTKEFLHYLLRRQAPTLATEGNLNNHLGLPLTLFKLNAAHRFCVCELGTNQLGEVRQLARVLKPDYGLLTCIAPEHLESFGSLDNVYAGEIELFETMKPGSAAVIPDDDPVLLQKISGLHLQWVQVGAANRADYRLTEVRVSDSRVHFKVNGRPFSFPGPAAFLAKNAAMAIAMAEVCGVRMQEMPEFWEDLKLPAGRFQENIYPPGIRVIFDGYNASPASFEAALKTFGEMRAAGRKILVFSDMLELGPAEKEYHEILGELIAQTRVDAAVAYGTRAKWSVDVIRGANPKIEIAHKENAREAAEWLRGRLQAGDVLLLKASRGMKIEEVINPLFESRAGSLLSQA